MTPQSAQGEPGTEREFLFRELTGEIISCAIEVHSALGPGLLETVYENALEHEFRLRGICFERQKEIALEFKGRDVGLHRIDFLVESKIILELKSVQSIAPVHEAQLLTYLKALNKRVGLLINFNSLRIKDGLKRMVN